MYNKSVKDKSFRLEAHYVQRKYREDGRRNVYYSKPGPGAFRIAIFPFIHGVRGAQSSSVVFHELVPA